MSALPPDSGDPATTRRRRRAGLAEGGKRKGRVKTHHTVAKAVGATMVVIALVTGLTVVFLYRHYNGNLNVKDIGARARHRPARRPRRRRVRTARSTSWSWARTTATHRATTSTT